MSVELIGHEEVVRRFEKLENPPKSAIEALGEKGVDGLEANYSGNPLGWAKLKPDTVRRKGHSRILFDTGTMMHSYGFRPKGTLEADFYSKDKPGKVAYHQKTRPHLVLQEKAKKEMLSAYLQEMLKP